MLQNDFLFVVNLFYALIYFTFLINCLWQVISPSKLSESLVVPVHNIRKSLIFQTIRPLFGQTTLFGEVKALTLSSEKVEKMVDFINLKARSTGKRLKFLETRVKYVKTSCAFMSCEFVKNKRKIPKHI